VPKLQPVDESFFTSAPKRWSETFAVARPAAEVWDEISGERALHWCRAISVDWTSARPFGVGTTRRVKVLGGVLSADERFFAWEEGRRYAFHLTNANMPLFRSLAEDYVVEPDGESACRFTWTIAAAPTALGRPGAPVNAALFGSLFRDTRRYFASR
jgi:hypothetical protein